MEINENWQFKKQLLLKRITQIYEELYLHVYVHISISTYFCIFLTIFKIHRTFKEIIKCPSLLLNFFALYTCSKLHEIIFIITKILFNRTDSAPGSGEKESSSSSDVSLTVKHNKHCQIVAKYWNVLSLTHGWQIEIYVITWFA